MKVTFIAQQHKYNPDSTVANQSGRNTTRPKRLGQADQKKGRGGGKKEGKKEPETKNKSQQAAGLNEHRTRCLGPSVSI
jgi:hypothetical protein